MVLIAVVVLLIACINFINLTTAAFTKSSFQTGLRKILGASRKELVLNNLLQTLLQTTFAFGLAYGLALLLLPYFNGMIGGSLRIADFMNGSIIWIGATIVITTTVLAGLYPAIYISSFKPISALRSDRNVKGWNARVRQGLVGLQFCI